MRISINGTDHEMTQEVVSHEEICKLAGESVQASVVYRGPRNGDSQRSGTTYPGKSVRIEDGMMFDAVVTNNA